MLAIDWPERDLSSTLHVVIRKSQPQVFSSAFCLTMEFPMLLLHLSHCDTQHTHTYRRSCTHTLSLSVYLWLSLSLACACRRRRRSVGFQQRCCYVHLPRKSTRTFHCALSPRGCFSLYCWKMLALSLSLPLGLNGPQQTLGRPKNLTGNLCTVGLLDPRADFRDCLGLLFNNFFSSFFSLASSKGDIDELKNDWQCRRVSVSVSVGFVFVSIQWKNK